MNLVTNLAVDVLFAVVLVALGYFIYLYVKYFRSCDVCGGHGQYLNAERYEFVPCPKCKGKNKAL